MVGVKARTSAGGRAQAARVGDPGSYRLETGSVPEVTRRALAGREALQAVERPHGLGLRAAVPVRSGTQVVGVVAAEALFDDEELAELATRAGLDLSLLAGGRVLVGRTASDVIYNVLSLAIMAITGLLVGWRIHTSPLEAGFGFVLLLAFAYAFSWVMAYVGLLVPSVEVINNASFIVIFPLTFIANTFVPSENLPGVLRAFAEWNPVSAVTQAARELFGNIPAGSPATTVWPMQNAVLYTIIWIVAIIAVFAPLAVNRYRRYR